MRLLTLFLFTAILNIPLVASEALNFNSQACQDEFVYNILYKLQDCKEPGYYLEIGAGDPIHINNTYVFEKSLSWQGLSIDSSEGLKSKWYAVRSNTLLSTDAIQLDYKAALKGFPKVIDYLSLDIDGNYHKVLERLKLANRTFKVITIEHDAYRFGDVFRNKEREILSDLGYYLLCGDVSSNGCAYEDWWINPDFFDSIVLDQLSSLDLDNREYVDIIRIISEFSEGEM